MVGRALEEVNMTCRYCVDGKCTKGCKDKKKGKSKKSKNKGKKKDRKK